MRKLIALFSILFLFACSKSEYTPFVSSVLVGKWRTADSFTYEFFDDGLFVVNDSIYGNYENVDGCYRKYNWYTEDNEGEMEIVSVGKWNSTILIKGLPYSDGDTYLYKTK